MTVTLLLGRHGETKLNSEDKLRGWVDVPLNADGVKEAEAMSKLMESYDLKKIYASDLDRADHTARIVAEPHKLKVIPRQWFRPLNYGDLNGKPLSEVKPTLLKLNDIWSENPDHEAPGGESFTEFQDRNIGGLHAVLSSADDGDQVMIVAHLRNCLLFHAVAVLGGPLKGKDIQMMDGTSWHQESGSVSHFEWSDGVLKFIGLLDEGKK